MNMVAPMHLPKVITLLATLLTLSPLPSQAQAQGANSPEQAAVASTTTTQGGIGFKTVAEALETLKAIPGARVSVTKPDSWVIISEPGGMVVWSFTPQTHPAYPAVVRRAVVVGSDNMARLEMSGLCQAEKAPCDKLMAEFRELNDNAARAVQERMKGSKPQ
jgi:hypothetical protein